MDAIIRHIIDIDKRADDILAKTDEYIREGEKNFGESIAGMRADTLGKAREEAQKIYDSIIIEAEDEANNIKGSVVKVCGDMEDGFERVRDDVESRILSRLLKEDVGGQV